MSAMLRSVEGALLRREQRRRRVILFAIAALILLGMSPILGHHVGSGIDRLLAGTDHVGALCLIALHYLLEPVYYAFHVLLLVGLAYAAWDRMTAGRQLRRTLSALPWRQPSPGSTVELAAREAGVAPTSVWVAPGLPVPAFTAGWLRPRIYVAQDLASAVSADELVAVIAHEAAHAARRDPLRLSVLRFMALTLFWIPVLRRLAEDCADEAEVRADDAAARGRPLVLASALVRLASWRAPVRVHPTAVGINRPDLLDRRVRRLAGQPVQPGTHVTRRSLAAALGMLLLVWTTGTVMAHPLPAAHDHAPHCEHSGSAWAHLFCKAEASEQTGASCPRGHL